ncbi:MAG: tRNA (adenosine(37)-N6)-threonylcarbamoyltransferase complex dimerization subunit type 1 TsaB, partial [Nevskiaceae bacterium]
SVDGAVRGRFEPMQREHTQKLLPMIHAVLAEAGKAVAQLDGIVCGIGPGSFAGLRIGLGVVKGLALARDLPVAGVSSLAMLAQRVLRVPGAGPVAAVIDARMSEIYFGAYGRDAAGLASAILADRVCPPDQVPALPEGAWTGVGTGWGRYEAVLRAGFKSSVGSVDASALPHAGDALALGVPLLAAGRGQSADTLAPAYLRDRVALTVQEQARLRR